jgi:hypothetical protein
VVADEGVDVVAVGVAIARLVMNDQLRFPNYLQVVHNRLERQSAKPPQSLKSRVFPTIAAKASKIGQNDRERA